MDGNVQEGHPLYSKSREKVGRGSRADREELADTWRHSYRGQAATRRAGDDCHAQEGRHKSVGADW